jgi:hypothetical protein
VCVCVCVWLTLSLSCVQAYELLGGEPPPAVQRLAALAAGAEEGRLDAKL